MNWTCLDNTDVWFVSSVINGDFGYALYPLLNRVGDVGNDLNAC